jgi:hypothetical protein
MQRFARMRQQNKHYVFLLVWGDDANRSIAVPLDDG